MDSISIPGGVFEVLTRGTDARAGPPPWGNPSAKSLQGRSLLGLSAGRRGLYAMPCWPPRPHNRDSIGGSPGRIHPSYWNTTFGPGTRGELGRMDHLCKLAPVALCHLCFQNHWGWKEQEGLDLWQIYFRLPTLDNRSDSTDFAIFSRTTAQAN